MIRIPLEAMIPRPMSIRNYLLALVLLPTLRLAAQSDGTITVSTAAELIDAVLALNYHDGPE